MLEHRSSRTSVAVSLLLTALLSGCVIAPARPYYRDEGPYEVAPQPPPPRDEVIGVAPVVGYLWLGGYWGWSAGRHLWVGGHWEAPRPGYRWMPHNWVQIRGGWRLNPGRWERG